MLIDRTLRIGRHLISNRGPIVCHRGCNLRPYLPYGWSASMKLRLAINS